MWFGGEKAEQRKSLLPLLSNITPAPDSQSCSIPVVRDGLEIPGYYVIYAMENIDYLFPTLIHVW